MSDYNLEALSPEEKDQLLSQLLAQHEAGGSPSEPQAPGDAEPDGDEGAVGSLLKVVEILLNVVDTLDQRLSKLEGVVMDDLIGGIDSLYKGNLRAKGVDGMRGKYAELFAPHADALKELSPDEDIFDKLYDLVEQAKTGTEGWDDTKESEMASGLASGIAEKIAKIRGDKPAADAAPVGGAGVTVEKVTASPVPEGADAALMDRIKKMKERNASKGL